MKISDFTGNMQALMDRGEVVIAVQNDAEPLQARDRGAPFGFMYWTEREPILTQTKTISRYAEPMEKRTRVRASQPDTGARLYGRHGDGVLPASVEQQGRFCRRTWHGTA